MSTHIWPWVGKLRGHEGIIKFGAGQLGDLDGARSCLGRELDNRRREDDH